VLENGQFGRIVKWDEQILIIYSVLVGLSLDKSFDLFTSSLDKISSGVLLVGIFIVVVENWIYLPIYFSVIDIDSRMESGLYIMAVLAYSCIPALYFATTSGDLFIRNTPQLCCWDKVHTCPT
jgi:hypothetical protein